MAYSTPITAVSSAPFTAAQFNASIRDNILVTPAALATTAGAIFAATGTNAIAQRIPTTAAVSTQQTTTSTTFADLATAGPAVTVTTGVQALVTCHARAENNSINGITRFVFAVSGATTLSADTNIDYGFAYQSPVAGVLLNASIAHLVTGLTPGSNTFTMKYRVDTASTGTFSARRISVVPF